MSSTQPTSNTSIQTRFAPANASPPSADSLPVAGMQRRWRTPLRFASAVALAATLGLGMGGPAGCDHAEGIGGWCEDDSDCDGTLACGSDHACYRPPENPGEIYSTDPNNDLYCADEPEAEGPPEMEIESMRLAQDGDALVVTLALKGDITAAHDELEDYEALPVSVQFWTRAGDYIEGFFEDKDHMKVVGNAAEVTYQFNGNELIITFEGVHIQEVDSARFSTFVSPLGIDGWCEDEVVHGEWPS